ncbi:hypothetical protein N0V90_000657 [Kalmusia sp. IMI 367209]|nr:hypothetical protein N0V90_000657 [Kalmusia sp. IMI 367209]
MLQEPGPLPKLSVLNRYPKSLQGPKYLHHLVRQSPARDGLAIDFLEDGLKRRKLTYQALHIASDALAGEIRAHLARLENASAVIPIFLPQSPELYVALLATLKAGRAFCPIGLDLPPQRIEFILGDISADLIITNTTLKDKLPASSNLQTLLVNCNESPKPHVSELEIGHLQQTRLAYVLYTSGSTGLPKAVSVSHRAVIQSLLAHDQHIPPFTRFLQFAAPTFDVSIFEIFFPLYRGCTLVGCTRTNMLNDLPATISSLGVDAAELTPTAVSNLLRGRKSVPGLRLLLTIGEMLTRDVVDEFGGNDHRPSLLWGMYGPTEAAIHCTVQPNFPSSSPLGNIGYPLETVTALIAAPVPKSNPTHGVKILPVGEVGEMIIGGPQVADEYLNRPELTSASFIHDQEFGYLYRTGDKARMRTDGTLECLGRIVSGQVKLRGQRVELGEIEQTIMKIDDCFSAVAMVIQETLVAFCATDTSVSSTAVQEICRHWLPGYMVPADVILLSRMPQLSSGKVDKRMLEMQYLDQQRQPGYSESLSDIDSGDPFSSIFRISLGRHVTDDEGFAHIGLDSLRSIQIASSLRKQGFEVGPIDILAMPNLGELKKICNERKERNRNPKMHISIDLSLAANIAVLQGRHNDIADILPCTPLQEAMLTETVVKPSAYCNWIEVELFKRLDFRQIHELLNVLIHQNEILRTGFCMADITSGTFIQVIWKHMQPVTVTEVATFSRAYSIGSAQSLLQPFTVQVITTTQEPRLLFQIHHALYDGWSFDLLMHDLNKLIDGHSVTPRPQFREVTAYYLQVMDSDLVEKSRNYWRKVLHNYCPVTLPNFNGKTIPYHGLHSFRGESAVDLRVLSASAKEHAIHPQVFYQASLLYVLSQYLGVSDTAIGTVTSGRTIPVTHIEEIMGPCIVSLPFRMNLSDCDTIVDLLQKTQLANRDMLEHCNLPLRNIAKMCQLHPGEHLFDVLFVWQESLVSAENRKLSVRMVDSVDDLEFKLTFEVEPRDDSIAYRLTYDPSIIPEKQIKQLVQQVDHTVQFFVLKFDEALAGARIHFDPELLSIANPHPQQNSFHRGPASSVEKWAVKSPDKNAIVIGSSIGGEMRIKESLTYASLNTRANQLAHALVTLGIRKDELVCVLLEKSIGLYVSILAILKTGSGYLPIVPGTPTERVARILADADIKLCISDFESSKNIRCDGLNILDLDKLCLSNYSSDDISIPYSGDHLAYAVFTSGSTGKPKGVLVTQDNLMSNLEHLSSIYPYTDDSKLLQSCSQAFDVSVFEIFFSWYVGICLCTADKDDLFYDFEAAIDNLDITHLSLTPTVAGLVDPARVPKVKFLVTAGEALTESVRRKWTGKGLYQGMVEIAPFSTPSNRDVGYGPSETTNICTVNPCVAENHLINNIGPVFPNTSLLILEPGNNNPVPRGAIGELCFGGTQVFRGYQNRPDLNAQKILEHPTYGRIYRSGDMGRLLPDDSILFTGRLDDQVKIRGQRVELGEITSIVLDHTFVYDCTTVLIDNDHARQQLVVFWVPKVRTFATFRSLPLESYRPHALEIFESLSLQLPAYMIPTHVVPISSIPMTPQAKVDKRLLHSTFDSLTHDSLELASLGSVEERDDNDLSESEQKIAEGLSRTLDLPLVEIKRNSSFFNLGLDSVSAIRFARDLRDVGFGHIPVSSILKNPTLERLRSVLEEAPSSKSAVSDNPTVTNIFSSPQISRIFSDFCNKAECIEKVLPCTPLQEAMLSSGSSEETSYYNVMAFNVNGHLDHLKTCWERSISRHDILRTTFVSTDNPQYAFAQVVLKHESVIWDEIDPSLDLTEYAKRLLPRLLQSHKPPIRFAIQGNGTSTRLIFCCHHALYDGVAIANLLDEIQDLYLEKDLPAPVPYEVYLRHIVSQDLKAAHRFWSASLANFEPTYFPDLSSRTSRLSTRGHTIQRPIQIPLSEALSHCRESSASLLSLVHAAWVKLLHFVLGEMDVCFGNVISGRTLPEAGLDRLVAPCFNTLPVRLAFDFRKPNAELSKKLHSFNVDALSFQLTPLRWIQSKIRQEQGRLFDTLVILQQPSTPLNDSIWSLEIDDGEMDLPIVCEVVQDKNKDALTLNLHYQDNLCEEDDAEALAEIFDTALQSLVRFPNSAANDTIGFPNHLLAHSNMSFRSFDPPHGKLLHSAFEQNATDKPNAIALEFRHSQEAGTSLTFLALNEKANQVAHALIQLGIKPEDVVPVYMPKSPEFYVSILGILKAGGAFSPIHPDLPEARKRFMISELRPKVILSRETVIDWLDEHVVLNVNETGDQPIDNPSVKALRPTNLAYCLYTSGSTGVPKAVSMEHRSPIQTIESSRSLIPWNLSSRLLQYAAITFDMCYYDCFLAWSLGFTLCAAEQEAMLNNLSDSINALNVDLLDLTPSVAISLRRAEVPNVKWLYCIGEAMTSEVVTEWAGSCVNSYGPTEAAFCTTISPATPKAKTSVIGKPFPTTSFAVFPPEGERLVPVFGAGELYIGGAQLARGYFGKPELSEQRFLHKCGQRFYRSGDMVRMLSDGNFEFLGRTDDQVKIRGLRVELGEINSILQGCDDKITAVTTQILKKESTSKEQLVAFLVLQCSISESEQTTLKLKVGEKAAENLPSYMVPQFFLFIEKIPKSIAGKTDKNALKTIFQESRELNVGLGDIEDDPSNYSWSEREDFVRDIFAKLSDTPREDIKPWTSIYQLGLDSISAVQIAASLRKHDLQVNAADVMRYMSCKDLVAFLERHLESQFPKIERFDFDAFERKHRTDIIKSCGIRDEQIETIWPCTPLQNGMLSQFIAREGAIYFNYLRLRLKNNTDLRRLHDAWLATIQKHRMLRTGFSHVKDSNTSFAMVHYKPDAQSLPWKRSDTHLGSIEAWLQNAEHEVVKNLHQPPWRVRVHDKDDAAYLDIAILHAIFDAQSLRLIFDDLAVIYNGGTLAMTAPLEPVIENALHLSNNENSPSITFWKQLGKGAAPTRFPNLAPLRYDTAEPVVIVKPSSRTINELDLGCRASNISLQIAGLAGWATLLSNYTGESSVTFGVVLSGRNFDGADSAVFPCITTVPFTCKVSNQHDEMLKGIMSLNTEIQQHQFTPLNEIQKLMGFPNEALFDSIFAFQKVASGSSQDDMWTVVDERATIEYPLSIELEPKDGRLEYRLTFLPHIVPKEHASLILNQLDYLIQRYVFSDTDVTFDPEIYSITPANTPIIPSEAKLLHEFVELATATYPTRIALEFASSLRHDDYASQRWTYAQLDNEGNRIANLLLSNGVQPGELVGICFEKCPEASFAILGILKAGCAFVALDPGAPSSRKAFILEDSGAQVVLSMIAQSSSFTGNTNATVLNLDEVNWRSVSPEKPSLKRKINPQDRSYCLYTSGTTGTPKGCELTHENAVQAMLAFRRLFSGHWDDESRWLQFASFHFDVSVLEQYWSWSVGICVVSAPRDIIFEDLASSISTLRITHIDLTPSLARILHPDDVPTLCKGVFITGGESLKQEILDVWGPKSVIYNGYGPTEATIGVTMYPRVPTNGKPSNIGPQFDNVGSYVLRPGSDVPVLRGGLGELCVSGELVGKGYLNRPQLTEERFPHLSRFNERVYRTGDLVRILHDGAFDFVGRADDQVKLRGQRLEIGEINSVVKQCGIAVADVATQVLKHPKQQKEQLVTFMVLGSATQDETKIVLEKTGDLWKAKVACQEKLPPYMVPTHFVALTAMPLSANNKAEARKLKEMYEALSISDLQLLSSTTQTKDEKWTKQEERVRDVIKEALHVTDDFSKDVSFFELGMDSISVIGVSRALTQAGISRSAASVVLKNSTVRRLSKALSDRTSAASDHGSIIAAQQAITAVQHRYKRDVAEILFMDTRNIEALAPCTPLQQGMIARSLDSDHGLYFNSFRFKLRDDVDIKRLGNAWISTFASTQIMRTVFINTEDGFVQAVLRNAQLSVDEATLPKNGILEDYLQEKKDEWVQFNRTHIKRPMEVSVIATSQGKLSVVRIFHALYDGNSIDLIFKSVWDSYNSREIVSGPAFHSALAHGPLRPMVDARQFWEKHLEDRNLNPIPTLSESPTQKPIVVTREVQNLPNFDATRRKLNVTAQAIAQACWVSVMYQYLKATVTIGMVVSGRSIDFEGVDEVIGPLFNTIPYQYCAHHRETWASSISRTHEFNVAAHQYQHTPLREILKWVKRGPEQPLFDTLFVYQIAEDNGEWMRNDLWELQNSEAEADYPLAIEVEQTSGGVLRLTLITQGHVSDMGTANHLLERYERALREAVESPEMVVETIVAENKWNATDNLIKTNGESDAPEPTVDFEWSSYASTIRREIASLSKVDIKEVNANTSIFELGLDSIDAIRLSSKLKKHGIDLPVSGIMRNLNIVNMVQHISISKGKKKERPSDMIYKANKKRLEGYLQRHGLTEGVEQVLPLTPLQEAMVADMITSEYTRYYNHDVLQLESGVDIERLKEAWMEVVKESPILRTSFIQVDDPGIDFSHVQTIRHKPHEFWRSTDIDFEPHFPIIFESIREEAMTSKMSEPLFHIRLVQSPRQAYLILSIPHALYDGWSLGLLHSDIHRAYTGNFQSRPSYEPALHEILTTSGSDAAAFWRDYLSGAKPAVLPCRTSTGDQSPLPVYRKQQVSHLTLDDVKTFAKKQSITLQTLGQAIHGLTTASYTKSLDVTFGSVLSGRDDETRSRLLFPTMNTVAIRTILHGSRCEMLQYVQDNFSNIKQWQHFPLRKALSLAGAQGTLLGSLFIYQKNMGTGSDEREKLYESIQGQSNVEYPVCVEMEVIDGNLIWRCAVKEEVFDEDGAQRLLDRFDDVLKAIISQPDAPVIDFTADGTSICGLPAFASETRDINEEDESGNGQYDSNRSASPTANIIRELLAFVSKTPEEEITSGTTIFHIGLDSISAIKVASLLRKRGVILSVGEMLRAGTVEEMARIADEHAPDMGEKNENIDKIIEEVLSGIDRTSVLRRAEIKEDDVERVLPATAGQTYMLSMWLNSNGAVFYPEFRYRIHEPVSFETLKAAWKKVVARNPMLRTCFCASNDERTPYIQVVIRDIDDKVANITEIDKQFLTDTRAKFGSQQPYAHFFVSQSSNGWDIRLKIHHALYDGVSLPLIIQQLQDLCNNIDVPSSTDILSRAIATTSIPSAIQQRKIFWTNYLKNINQHHLPQPTTSPTTKSEIFKPALLPTITDLESQAHKHGLTTQSLFLAAYAKLYARLTSTPPSNDIVIGLYLANRSLPIQSLPKAAIPTVNLVTLRVSTPLETHVFDVAAQIQYDIQEISAPANASASLWEVHEWTGVKIDTFVNFLKLPETEESAGAVGDGSVSITQSEEWNEGVSRIHEVDNGGVEPPRVLIDGRINGAYLHSLDVEATVRNGALDVGVFAPGVMMGLEEGEKLVDSIRLGLVGVGESM